MKLLMNILPYLIIILISIPVSGLLYGLANFFVRQDEIDNMKSNAIKPKNDFKISYNIDALLITILLECILFYFKGISIDFFVMSFLISILIISFFTDIKACIIPNETNFLGFIVGIIYSFITTIFNFEKGFSLLFGGIVGFLIFLAIYGFSLLVFKKEGMGGGDIKLMGVIGLFVGFSNIIQVFVFSFLIGAIISVFLLIFHKKEGADYIPFGPFIVIATYITMLMPALYTYNQIYRFMIYNF